MKKEIEQLPSKENSRTKENSPNIFVLRNSEENEESLLQYEGNYKNPFKLRQSII